jgi:hypothetical protein
MPLLADGYTLSCQRTHWLRKKIDIAAVPGDVTGADVEMVNGDAYQDGNQAGRINLLDLACVLLDYGATSPEGYSDLNEDGSVGLTDLGIVLLNFGMVADPA